MANTDLQRRLDLRDADLIVSGGHLVTPGGITQGDVVCLGGRVVALDAHGWSSEEAIDARGLHVLPGVIDSQVHFREPGMEHKETIEAGSRGAVLGGVTAVFEMPNTKPLTISPADLEEKQRRAAATSWCDYAFYIGGSAVNASQLAELEQLPGCAGVKVFMGSSFGDLLCDDRDVLRIILKYGYRRVAIHAEDEARLRQRRSIAEVSGRVADHPLWRDPESCLMATRLVVDLALELNRPLHLLHISTAEEMTFLAQHKDLVSVEVTPQHLSLSAPGCYERLGSLAQMNPPIREEIHQQALWRALATGVVDVIGSDHAPHTLDEKQRPYPASPSGMPGVQTLVPVMLDHVHAGRLSLQRFVDLTSAGPTRLFGLVGKGRLAVGYDADLTVVDLSARRTIERSWIASVSGWSPFEHLEVRGWPMATVIRGSIVMLHDALVGTPRGRSLHFRPIGQKSPLIQKSQATTS